MKNVLLSCFALFVLSCGQETSSDANNTAPENTAEESKKVLEDRAKMIDDIAFLENDLSSSPDGKMHPQLAKELIDKSVEFATLYKDDPRSAPYLFRAGDVAKGIGMPDKAIELWEMLRTSYPDHEKAAPAMFLQGFTWENDFNNYENAKKVYTEFLRIYPDHQLAVQVKSVLNTLGVPPEELVKSFQKK